MDFVHVIIHTHGGGQEQHITLTSFTTIFDAADRRRHPILLYIITIELVKYIHAAENRQKNLAVLGCVGGVSCTIKPPHAENSNNNIMHLSGEFPAKGGDFLCLCSVPDCNIIPRGREGYLSLLLVPDLGRTRVEDMSLPKKCLSSPTSLSPSLHTYC